MIKASVVIPAFNEEKNIRATLSSLLESEQGSSLSVEVILVDNNSTDKTVKIAQEFQNRMDLKIYHEKRQGRGAARARGFNEAKGEIILSGDCDTVYYKGWIETLASEIKGETVASTTTCLIRDFSALKNTAFNIVTPLTIFLYRIIFGHYWLSGFSFAVSKSAYEKSGGFDPSLQALEDMDLTNKVAKVGKIKFINKPVIFSGRRFKDGLISGLFEYVSAFIEIFVFKKKNIFIDNPR